MVRVAVSYDNYLYQAAPDEDTFRVEAGGHTAEETTWDGGFSDSGVHGSWIAHNGSSLTVKLSAIGLEGGDTVEIGSVKVYLYLPTVSISGGGTTTEADDTPFSFTVSRDVPTGYAGLLFGDEAIPDTTVPLDITGTATPGDDFDDLPTSVDIENSGSSSIIPFVPVPDSNDLEVDEAVHATTQPSGGLQQAPAATQATGVITGRNGMFDKGRVGEALSWWVQPGAAAGGQGNEAVGSIQTEVAPVVETGTGADGKAWAKVKAGTGEVIVDRSFTGQKSGDQGVGVAGSAFAGQRVYVSPQLASDLDKHEQGHVDATEQIYGQTLKLAVDKVAFYRTAFVGNVNETEAQLKARVEADIDWNNKKADFIAKDTAVNGGNGPGSFHAWETAQGGGPLDNTGPGVVGGVTYGVVLRSREETDVNYNIPNYGNFVP